MNCRHLSSLLVLIIVAFASLTLIGLAALPGDRSKGQPEVAPVLAQAQDLFQSGRFERGIEILESLTRQSHVRLSADEGIEVSLLLARGYEAVGRYTAARAVLEDLQKNKDLDRRPDFTVQAYDLFALALTGLGETDAAREALDRGIELAKAREALSFLGFLLNDLGTLQAATGEFDAAGGSFAESNRLASTSNLRELEAVTRINWVRTLIYAGHKENLEAELSSARKLVTDLPLSYQKALYLLTIGSHYRLAQWRFGLGAEWRGESYASYRAGLEAARKIANQRLISNALGSIGRLYEDEGRYIEALQYTRQAAFVAQEADAADVLYLWQWQAARLIRMQGDHRAAIAGYRVAIQTLKDLRSDLTRSGLPFQSVVGSVFREMADLLLQHAATDKEAGQRDLLEVRTLLEELRQAEVAEYFKDDCVVQTQGAIQLDKISKNAAVIYPIVLRDRTELLVSLAGTMERFSVPVGVTELTAAVRDFRRSIEVFDATEAYLPHSRHLYDWLIKPVEEKLREAAVNTLVIVPDGPLRTIPISALNDGKQFLVEKYAVVTTPGLMLTRADPGLRARVHQALASGLTQSVQGFNPLPNVSSELASVASTFPTTRLQDSSFQKATVEREVSAGRYSIVHFATHGHFDSDHSRSFLVTFDGQITMDDLQGTVGQRRYREEAIELLVLSACQTAAGDDRAALGLAGVGLKAGARSVVASLWSISDESTSILIAELYRQLKDSGSTKAQALRAAQLALVGQAKYHHPYFWAPFVLIGNWL